MHMIAKKLLSPDPQTLCQDSGPEPLGVLALNPTWLAYICCATMLAMLFRRLAAYVCANDPLLER